MQPYAHVEFAAKTIACIEQFEATRSREDAAHAAAQALMYASIRGARGGETTIFDLADACDVADAVEHAVCDLFIALTQAGMTYRAFHQLSGQSLLSAPRRVRAAVRHFYAVIANCRDLHGMAVERGELLLAPLDWHIDNYLHA